MKERVREINKLAPMLTTTKSVVPLSSILNLKAFDPDPALIEPYLKYNKITNKKGRKGKRRKEKKKKMKKKKRQERKNKNIKLAIRKPEASECCDHSHEHGHDHSHSHSHSIFF